MWDQTCVALDLELSGLEPPDDHIIEVGAVKFRGHEVLDSWSTLVRPPAEVPYRIQRLTGIDPADLEGAPSLPEIAGHLIKFLGDHPIVGHSIDKDIARLQRKGFNLSNPLIDTYELATILLPQSPSYTLAAVAEALGVPFTGQHRAAADALASKEVLEALWRKASDLDLKVIQEMNRLAEATEWPLSIFFREVERGKSHQAFVATLVQERRADIEGAILDVPLLAEMPAKPLTPTPERQPLDEEELVALMEPPMQSRQVSGMQQGEPGGLIAENLPGYEYRESQVSMMRAVIQALNQRHNLIVEAGTGTGKSLAYLIPAIYFAVLNGEPVVISTNTINLQDQLFFKDIPTLKNILPINFRAALVKGRNNYLCLWRYSVESDRPHLSRDEALTLSKLTAWLPSTRSGDVNELNLTPRERSIWPELATTEENCIGDACPYLRRNRCFLFQNRDQAVEAHLIVVNHALLLSDLATGYRILPDYRYLIIDEAHHLEREATEQFSYRISQREVERYFEQLGTQMGTGRGERARLLFTLRGLQVPATTLRDAEMLSERITERVESAREGNQRLFSVLDHFLATQDIDSGSYERRYRITTATRVQPAWTDIDVACENFVLRLSELHRELDQLQVLLADILNSEGPEGSALLVELNWFLTFNHELRRQLNSIIAVSDPKEVCWLSSGGTNGEDLALHAAPLDVGDLLNEKLFGEKDATILTSATLTAGRGFEYIKGRLGFAADRELKVRSPFDYRLSTLVYCPTDIPEPGKPGYQRTVEQAIIDASCAIGGKTLVLFTSYQQLGQTYRRVRESLAKEGLLVLAQGVEGASRRHLLEALKSNSKTVLLGASSFWEGIDVVGENLSLLIIVRFPFSVPTDPVFAARSETFEEPFNEYAVPQAVLRFKQGFGRLIRSKTDRGVLVVLDRRLQTKSYGKAFLSSLPACTVKLGPIDLVAREVAQWLNGPSVFQKFPAASSSPVPEP